MRAFFSLVLAVTVVIGALQGVPGRPAAAEHVAGGLYAGTLSGSAAQVVLLVSNDGARLLHASAFVTPDCGTSGTAPFDAVPAIESHGFQLTLTSAVTGNRIDLSGSFGANGNASGELRFTPGAGVSGSACPTTATTAAWTAAPATFAITPNSTYGLGANAIVVEGVVSAAAAAAKVFDDSGRSVQAIWVFSVHWRFYLPEFESIDGGIRQFPGPVASAFAILE